MSQVEHEPIEEMAAFFDRRAAGYDDHIRGYVYTEAEFTQFYQAVAQPLEPTGAALQILDLGCGTGLELDALFSRAPNAQITGVDISQKMLALLKQRYASRLSQITLLTGSYLDMIFPENAYDYVVSAMTMHHLVHDAKRNLYRKIRGTLKPGGTYVEGDSVTSVEWEGRFLRDYLQLLAEAPGASEGEYHVDAPFSIATQKTLLLEAGFSDFELLWQKDPTAEWNAAVYKATA